MQNYGENHYDNSNSKSIHAEMDVLRKVSKKHTDRQKKKNKKAYNLIVIRTSRQGNNFGMSKLCERCVIGVNKIQETSGIKIKKIYYTTGEGEILEKTTPTKMLYMENQHISSYYKNNGYKSKLGNKNHFICGCCTN